MYITNHREKEKFYYRNVFTHILKLNAVFVEDMLKISDAAIESIHWLQNVKTIAHYSGTR